eukprot:13671388-Alexandrium_andersonii.AAC.1
MVPREIPSMAELLQAGWRGLSQTAQTWGLESQLPTAQGHNARTASRIDAILANDVALAIVIGLERPLFGKFDVHACLSCVFRTLPVDSVRSLRHPRSVGLPATAEEVQLFQRMLDYRFITAEAALTPLLGAMDMTEFFR